jgi:biopolymer transport protein ExbB
MTADRLLALAAESGGVLYIMALLLLVALTVIIERSWYLRQAGHHLDAGTRRVAGLTHLDRPAIEALMQEAKGSPQEHILSIPLHYPEVTDPTSLSQLLEEAIMVQVPKIDQRIWILDTIVTLAPLLGLFGTIIGMFNAFDVLGRPGSAPTAITGGIAEALVATACGLFIAILGLVFFNGLNNRVRLVVHQLETIKIMLVNRLDTPRSMRHTTVICADGPSIHTLTAAAKG